jgi:hypothetical protein
MPAHSTEKNDTRSPIKDDKTQVCLYRHTHKFDDQSLCINVNT